ncbi:MAG: hydroxyacylglutathione hydrolase [Acidobacteria bacterium]|nr:hydroxyacylglutathione hydrolase [Acidobacteriota bacterium]
MDITPLKALDDNYIYLLVGRAERAAACVDPGEAGPVREFLQSRGLRLDTILVTHHHGDHTGGNRELLQQFPGAHVLGGATDRARIPGLTRPLANGDAIEVLGQRGTVLDVPGHTTGHVAYFFPAPDGGDLFSGDTVFGGTIGNLFGGTPEQMLASIAKIRALPAGTRIWCAHEYTLTWVREAARLDPGNGRLRERLARLEAHPDRPTVPLLLEEELATNPYFRWDDPALQKRLGTPDGPSTFFRLCEME